MIFHSVIEQNIEIIRELENTFRDAQNKEILPLSFFSSSIEIINRLKAGLYEIETIQLKMMQEHIKKTESDFDEEESLQPAFVLGETVGKKINKDFEKSLSLNDKFMFQRSLFNGNANEMNHAFKQLSTFQSLNEALMFLSEEYNIAWDSDPGITLKELLDKRFA